VTIRIRRACDRERGRASSTGVLASLTPARMRRALPVAIAILAALTAVSVAAIDRPLARFLSDHGGELRPMWRGGVGAAETITGLDVWKWLAGTIVLSIGAILFAIPRTRRYAAAWWFVGGAHLISRIGGNQLKSLFSRLRPTEWLAGGGDGATFFVDGGIAMPSGHVAHFLGLVLPLAILRPRIGLPLLSIPLFVAWARVATNAHFLSDVLAGATWTALATLALARLLLPPPLRG
jgi:membrane-associated phospholipid phosphatase